LAVQIGLKDLHYALLTTDTSAAITYATPVKIAGIISAKITPAINTITQYADDGPDEVASALGEITLELTVKDIALATQAILLGHTVDTKKVIIKKSSDTAPYLAIGFKSVKSNGKYRFVWLYKGKFGLPEQSFKTKEENVEFQSATIVAVFVKRVKDSKWMSVGDEDASGFNKAATWFNAVV